MTDRYKGCVVTFDRDIREDDVEPLVTAIRLLRGVASVDLKVSNPEDHMNRELIRQEFEKKLWDALHDDPKAKRGQR